MIWALILVGLFAIGIEIWVVSKSLIAALNVNTDEIKQLRLTSRTRINQVSVQSGARSEEQVLTRLGRDSRAKRVVVGGEEGSELHTSLTKQVNDDH